jgi:CMP-N,N'-diacetyllegionaminic acid synthase
MFKNKRIIGIITARGGSKGIPGKNIKDLAGKPLIAYSIEAVKKSSLLTRVILSTDSDDIIEVAKQYGADIPFKRPAELAEDKSTSMSVAQHALRWLKENDKENYDYLMILQPTSPLRLGSDIDESIRIAVENDADSVMSMVELEDFSVKKIKVIKDGLILPWQEEEGSESSRRQDIGRVYKRNCAIYLTKTEYIEKGDLFGEKSYAYIMPENRSVDINRLVDFELAEFWLNKNNNENV